MLSNGKKALIGRRLSLTMLLACLGLSVQAQPLQALPDVLVHAAKACHVDPQAVTLSVVPLKDLRVPEDRPMPQVEPLIAVNADRHVSPASTAKLVTTLAGLERLGANWRWKTYFYADERPDEKGRVSQLYLKGGGDPTLVVEKFALLVDRMAQLGVRHIEGDLVIDRSFFDLPEGDPSAFDGRGSRPYNQLPDAAVVGYRNLSFEFIPDIKAKKARIVAMPPLAGMDVPTSIPLSKGVCGDWKESIGYSLKQTKDGRLVVSFNGKLPKACGPKTFNVISLEADEFLERLFRGYWEKDGRTWTGHVRRGEVPQEATMIAGHTSDALSDVTVLVNKWSNNLIARHIYLSLGALKERDDEDAPLRIKMDDAREVLAKWLTEKGVPLSDIYIENGSGLSRVSHVTARAMTQLLAAGWVSPRMPEYMSSLPISGVDGTMRKRKEALGRAHLKTGYLADVRSIGGYIYAQNGERYAIFASVHGERNMPGGIRFLNRVIEWTYEQKPQK